ncbi:uncharacterized protein PITG_01501 [Phytophthora infestans T30-4]|uniref:Uncharacterized protein n=1 Tax=Phytophthora infestans (strain T30-4) TaxID=403677 RepID=D0MTE7_PHYIT|nr:uncharacterized protein PITG_01501 [Phytophthora infestans T30-4]EEY61244.1 hypothetical protein PITG_01501 [Phytophthora infestans T30-4]|eukprot:XP_002908161.1 hypothetical protein PITG_01501 [Phytophthora infestans T30-4]
MSVLWCNIHSAPQASLELGFAYGCRTALVVLYKKETHTQRLFRAHSNEVTRQARRSAILLVWNANDEPLGKRFECLKGHQVAVNYIGLSHDGKLVASLGADMYKLFAYGRLETHQSKKPGQALNDDNACYTLVSCGVRHMRFWTLPKTSYVPPPSKINNDSAFYGSTFGCPPRFRPSAPTKKEWKLKGNVPSFHGRFEVQDFTIAIHTTDHSLGGIVAGTAKGDLCWFLQPKASPDVDTVWERDSRQDPAKWWEIPDEYTDAEIIELVLERKTYELTGKLVDAIPHDQETGNQFKLPKQTQVEMEGLSKKLAQWPNATALHSRLDKLKYSGPLVHHGATFQVAYSKKLNLIMSPCEFLE